MGADLYESYVGSLISSCSLGVIAFGYIESVDDLSAPTSAALVKMPPPTRANRAMELAPMPKVSMAEVMSLFAFISGGFFSGLSGFVGMKIATASNSRTANACRGRPTSGSCLR